MFRTLSFIVAASFVALAVGACGGSDSISLAEWRTRADEVCATYELRSDALGEPETDDEIEGFLVATAALFSEQTAELRAVPEPDERADDVAALLDGLQALTERIEGLAERAGQEGGIEEVLGALTSIGDDTAALTDRARALGLTECGGDDDQQEGEAPTDLDVEVDPELGFAGSAIAAGIEQEGVPREAARCIALAVVAELGAERVLELGLTGADAPPEIVTAVLEAAIACDATEFLVE